MSQFSKYLEIVQEGKDYQYNEAVGLDFYGNKLKELPENTFYYIDMNKDYAIRKESKNRFALLEKHGSTVNYNVLYDDMSLGDAVNEIKTQIRSHIEKIEKIKKGDWLYFDNKNYAIRKESKDIFALLEKHGSTDNYNVLYNDATADIIISDILKIVNGEEID